MANNATVSLQIDLKAFNEGLKTALKMGEQWGVAMNGLLTGKVKMDTAGLDKALKDYQERVGKLGGAKVDVDTKSAVNSLQKLTGETEKAAVQTKRSATSIRDSFAMWGLALRGAQMAFSGMRRGLDMLTRPALEAEEAQEGLRASLRSTGIYTEELAAATFKYSSELQKITKYEDDAITSGTALMQNIGRMSADQLPQATKAAIGLAAAFRINLETAFELVGKAAAGSTATLGRYGIVLDDGLDPAEKFAKVLEIGADRFPLAVAAAKTGAGAIEQFKNTWGDMMETIGDGILPMLGGLLKFLKPIVEWFGQLNGVTKILLIAMPMLAAAWYKLVLGGKALALSAGGVVTGFKAAALAVKAFFTTMGTFGGVLMGATVAIAAVTGALYAKQRADEKQLEIQQQLVDKMGERIEKERAEANSTLTMVERYRQLASKARLLKSETDELAAIQKTMKERYPELITETNNYQSALVNMGNAAALARNKLYALAQQDVTRAQLQSKVDLNVARRDARTALTDIQSNWQVFWGMVAGPFGTKQDSISFWLARAAQALDEDALPAMKEALAKLEGYVSDVGTGQQEAFALAKLKLMDYVAAVEAASNAEKGIFPQPSVTLAAIPTGGTSDKAVIEGGTSGKVDSDKPKTALDVLNEEFDDFFAKQNREIDNTIDKLGALADYEERNAIIDANTKQGSDEWTRLRKRSADMRDAQIREADKRLAELELKDLTEYYGERTFKDAGYYDWKLIQIEKEVRAMTISKERQDKLIADRTALLDAEKAAWEKVPLDAVLAKYDEFKTKMADTKTIGVAGWAAIRDGLIAIRDELSAFADDPEVAAILKALAGEIDIAQMNAAKKKGSWFWSMLGFDPNDDEDAARVRGIQSTLGMMSTMMSDITNRAMNLNEQRKSAELERIETVAKAQGWSDKRLLAEKEKINKKYEKEAKKLGRIQKLMSLASATINVAEGVTEALTLGPILGPVMAGMIAAMGAVQIKLISEQEFKAGGYTGAGARDDVAGYVHRGEVVFEQPIVKENLPWLMRLRAMLQRGYNLADIFPAVNVAYATVPQPVGGVMYASGGYAGGESMGGLISELKGMREDLKNLKWRMDFDKRQVSRVAESGAKARRVIR